MVLYYADGTVVATQETYLEKAAHDKADSCRYTDPVDEANDIIQGRRLAAKDDVDLEKGDRDRVQIIIDKQSYAELYYSSKSTLLGEHLTLQRSRMSEKFPEEGIDRRTLMRYSSTAYDFFTLKPKESVLHLPVCYPRRHQEAWYTHYTTGTGKNEKPDYAGFKKAWGGYKGLVDTPELAYTRDADDQMAYIRKHEMTHYLFPWLEKMERYVEEQDAEAKRKGSDKTRSDKQSPEKLPKIPPTIEIPKSLVRKIHLYNVMLQLGISRHFKQPLIDALVFQMYRTDLSRCHLDTLEMTVGRFYSRGVAVLDPVINHLIGTYALRSSDDRDKPEPNSKKKPVLYRLPADQEKRTDDTQVYLPKKPERHWLRYRDVSPDQRRDFPDDKVSHPPKLEVIGHSIRHWSGVRRTNSTAAAHTGYPLSVGRVKKYYRRRAVSPIREHDKADYSTYRLHNFSVLKDATSQANFAYFRDNGPGGEGDPESSDGEDSEENNFDVGDEDDDADDGQGDALPPAP